MVKEGTGIPYKYLGASSHKVCTFNLQQNDEVQVSAYPGTQFECSELPFENGETRSHF